MGAIDSEHPVTPIAASEPPDFSDLMRLHGVAGAPNKTVAYEWQRARQMREVLRYLLAFPPLSTARDSICPFAAVYHASTLSTGKPQCGSGHTIPTPLPKPPESYFPPHLACFVSVVGRHRSLDARLPTCKGLALSPPPTLRSRPYYSFSIKTIGTCICVATGAPPFFPGLNFHNDTAWTAAASNSTLEDRSAYASFTLP